MLRAVGDQPSLWESILPEVCLGMPAELEAVDRLLDDPRFFDPYRAFFHATLGRPSVPVETYLRLMFLKYRYRLGFEPLCREVADSITWRRFCRIGLGGTVPHPTTLMKTTTCCGQGAVDGLNEALLAKAAEVKVLKTNCPPRRTAPQRQTHRRPPPDREPTRLPQHGPLAHRM